MTYSENESLKDDSTKSSEALPESANLISRQELIRRLERGPAARTRFVDSHINKTLAFQIRALRGELSQEKAMEKLGMNQNAISRLENPYYGKATLTTLKRIASAYDVGLLVEFVPFSKLVNHVSGTPYTDPGLSPSTMNVPTFEQELEQGTLEDNSIGNTITLDLKNIYPVEPLALLPTSLSQPKPVDDTIRLDVSVPSVTGAISTPDIPGMPQSSYKSELLNQIEPNFAESPKLSSWLRIRGRKRIRRSQLQGHSRRGISGRPIYA